MPNLIKIQKPLKHKKLKNRHKCSGYLIPTKNGKSLTCTACKWSIGSGVVEDSGYDYNTVMEIGKKHVERSVR